MSVLTKVFVVLVTFLSILLVALIVPFVAKTQDYQKLLSDERMRAQTAQVAARAKQAEITEIQARHTQTLTQMQSQSQGLARQLDTALDQLTETRTEVESLKADSAKLQASLSRISASNEQLGLLNESLIKEVNAYRDRAIDEERKNIELADRNNELTSQLNQLERLVRRSKEDNEELASELSSLRAAMERLDPAIRQRILGGEESAIAGAEIDHVVPEVPIAGAITAVETIAGDTYIQIDVGTNDGVEQNMKFWIHRNSQFLGTAVVEKVDVTASAARVNLVQEGSQIAKGDSVLTGGL